MSDSSTSDALVASLRPELDRMKPGERLPSSRDLIERFRVGPATVSRAIALLVAEGAVVTRPGSGTFVAPRRSSADAPTGDTSWQEITLAGREYDPGNAVEAAHPTPRDGIAMSGGYLHETLQPTRALGAALARAARRPDAWHRAPTAGLQPLRALFAKTAGSSVNADDVLITGGGQGALSMLFRALAAPDGPVLMESPTYPGALAAARAAGLRPIPVPMDGDGIRPDLLADAFDMTGARLLYCQPTLHNPSGTALATPRRHQILQIARQAGAFLIEDDFARHLSHGRPLPPPLIDDDPDGTVVYLTSLTKPVSPSLRIGAVIARGPVSRRLLGMRYVDDFFTARPLQEAAIELLSAPAWDRHLQTLRGILRERCATLVGALSHHLPDWTPTHLPHAGFHLWVRLPAGRQATAAAETARTRGVLVNSGDRYFPAEPPGAFLRLSFAAPATATELTDAAQRLR
ncbi:PLP-dependent aminotransferase family protein [Rhizohabitans arisaemae]|uniref:aminotransferase-like domain-containing protein n=1 Tax=Rhizohabitans arisaemae TaxID=2720610 RepID=UPI0024B0E7E4|nr:PLP-dependent aminotransferase family protein [Rhizohabitans arisaemae]